MSTTKVSFRLILTLAVLTIALTGHAQPTPQQSAALRDAPGDR
jgi:hypothetical protein